MTGTFPLSHPISVGDVPQSGVTVKFSADESERKALAAVYAVASVETLDAVLTVKPWRRDGLSVTGTVTASVTQPCVVTLVPVVQRVEEEIDLHFQPTMRIRSQGKEITIDPVGEDPPEVFDGDSLDLGAIAAEHVALGIDLYPRAPGVRFEAEIEAEEEDEEEPSPFAVLEQLKRDREE